MLIEDLDLRLSGYVEGYVRRFWQVRTYAVEYGAFS